MSYEFSEFKPRSKKGTSGGFRALTIGVFVAFGALAFMYFTKTKTVAVCRDVRVYMDGTYSATLEKGGLYHKTILTLYRLDNLKNKKIARYEVNSSQAGQDGVLYAAGDVRLQIAKKSVDSKFPGILEMPEGKSTMGCHPPTRGS